MNKITFKITIDEIKDLLKHAEHNANIGYPSEITFEVEEEQYKIKQKDEYGGVALYGGKAI